MRYGYKYRILTLKKSECRPGRTRRGRPGNAAMTDKILRYMEEYHMMPENGNLVAGVSGGADSVCLLCALVKLRDEKRMPLRLTAVHVNHGLRREAAEDADFVEKLCGRWRVSFVLVEEDVEELARREKLSCEEAGRKVRYRAFAQELARLDQKSGGHGCIAVAHNSDDRAETLLFHLFRGSGLSGMGSIRPVRRNDDGSRIIRPLLSSSRQEIEAFLRKEGLSWREDSTNAEDIYTRNKIRNRILPYAEEEICPQAKAHLAREAALLADTADFVEARTREAAGRCRAECGGEGEQSFKAVAFWAEEPFLQNQMLKNALSELGCQKDLTAAHVAEIRKLFSPSCQSGRKVVLPVVHICARRQFDRVILKRLGPEEPADASTMKKCGEREVLAKACKGPERAGEGNREPVPLMLGSFFVPGLGTVRARLLEGPAVSGDFDAFFKNIPEKKYTKWLDYDRILESATFRTRRAGDYLTINDALCRKSLKRYMIEERIPAGERDALMLFADGAHVIWVPGHRISAAYKVTADTATVLELCCDLKAGPDGGMVQDGG